MPVGAESAPATASLARAAHVTRMPGSWAYRAQRLGAPKLGVQKLHAREEEGPVESRAHERKAPDAAPVNPAGSGVQWTTCQELVKRRCSQPACQLVCMLLRRAALVALQQAWEHVSLCKPPGNSPLLRLVALLKALAGGIADRHERGRRGCCLQHVSGFAGCGCSKARAEWCVCCGCGALLTDVLHSPMAGCGLPRPRPQLSELLNTSSGNRVKTLVAGAGCLQMKRSAHVTKRVQCAISMC